MQLKKILAAAIVCAGIFIVFNNSLEVKQEKSAPAQDESMKRAQATFKEYCSGCHGALMQAFVDRKWKYGNSPEELRKSISDGRGDLEGGMPAFGKAFNEEQMNELVSYIRYGIENLDKYDFEKKSVADNIFEAEKFSFRLEKVVDGLESPWGMAFLPNGDMLVTDKSGELWRCKEDKSKTKITGVPEVLYKGQGGLLDIELHPNFAENKWLYLSYSIFKKEGGEILSATAVSRYTLKGNQLTESKLLLEALPYSTKRHHYGSRLEFDNDGYLFITVGDRGSRNVNPQDLSVYPGKVHRIHDDGRIPDDNPFVNRADAVNSIYSYGHRNQQGMVKNPTSGEIWTHEHGPRGGDEINIIKKAVNYGWPVISYGINYDGTVFTKLTEKEGMASPSCIGYRRLHHAEWISWKAIAIPAGKGICWWGLCAINMLIFVKSTVIKLQRRKS